MEEPQGQIALANRFKLGSKIGNGSFGEVYLATDSQTGQEVGVKIDLSVDDNSQIPHEVKILKLFNNAEGFPSLLMSGIDDKGKNFVAMDLLGANLESLFHRCGRKLSLKSVLMIADQIIKRVEFIHNKGFVYRDIKPDNFLIGKKGKQQQIIYIIDYGLVKRYKDAKTGSHAPYRDNKGLIGTSRYVSLNTHLGVEQSRRDDLESLGYVLIYFAKGRLPWQGLPGGQTKEEKYEKLKIKKIQTSIETLCEGLPNQFQKYIQYCRGLKFEEQPDYFYLKQLFKELFFELNYSWDCIFDWMLELDSLKTDQPKLNTDEDEEDANDCKFNQRNQDSLKDSIKKEESEISDTKKQINFSIFKDEKVSSTEGEQSQPQQQGEQSANKGSVKNAEKQNAQPTLSFAQILLAQKKSESLSQAKKDGQNSNQNKEEQKGDNLQEKPLFNLFKPAFPKKAFDLNALNEDSNLFDSIVNVNNKSE